MQHRKHGDPRNVHPSERSRSRLQPRAAAALERPRVFGRDITNSPERSEPVSPLIAQASGEPLSEGAVRGPGPVERGVDETTARTLVLASRFHGRWIDSRRTGLELRWRGDALPPLRPLRQGHADHRSELGSGLRLRRSDCTRGRRRGDLGPARGPQRRSCGAAAQARRARADRRGRRLRRGRAAARLRARARGDGAARRRDRERGLRHDLAPRRHDAREVRRAPARGAARRVHHAARGRAAHGGAGEGRRSRRARSSRRAA